MKVLERFEIMPEEGEYICSKQYKQDLFIGQLCKCVKTRKGNFWMVAEKQDIGIKVNSYSFIEGYFERLD